MKKGVKYSWQIFKKYLFTHTNSANQRWYVWGTLLLGLAGLAVPAYTLIFPIQKIQEEIKNLQPPERVLNEYFSNIEQGNYDSAWNLFSDVKKSNQVNGLQGFRDWLKDFVAFEGLQINEIKEKNGANTRVYIAEFDFKKRGMKPVHSIWGIYLKYDGGEWQIDYSNVLFENGWRKGACEFYSEFDICKM